MPKRNVTFAVAGVCVLGILGVVAAVAAPLVWPTSEITSSSEDPTPRPSTPSSGPHPAVTATASAEASPPASNSQPGESTGPETGSSDASDLPSSEAPPAAVPPPDVQPPVISSISYGPTYPTCPEKDPGDAHYTIFVTATDNVGIQSVRGWANGLITGNVTFSHMGASSYALYGDVPSGYSGFLRVQVTAFDGNFESAQHVVDISIFCNLPPSG